MGASHWLQAEQRVQEEAERRLASIGSDRTRWPAMARDEVLRLEKKQLVSAATACLFLPCYQWQAARKHPALPHL